MKRYYIFLIVLHLTSFLEYTPAQTMTNSIKDFFPFEVGREWVYRRTCRGFGCSKDVDTIIVKIIEAHDSLGSQVFCSRTFYPSMLNPGTMYSRDQYFFLTDSEAVEIIKAETSSIHEILLKTPIRAGGLQRYQHGRWIDSVFFQKEIFTVVYENCISTIFETGYGGGNRIYCVGSGLIYYLFVDDQEGGFKLELISKNF